jgi:hypothetical protein
VNDLTQYGLPRLPNPSSRRQARNDEVLSADKAVMKVSVFQGKMEERKISVIQ